MAIWSKEKVRRLTKGFTLKRKNCFSLQIRALFKSLQYQYISRRLRRRDVRKDHIRALNAGVQNFGIAYNAFIFGLNRSNILLDRKILSQLAKHEPYSFRAVFNEIRAQVDLPIKKQRDISYEEALQQGLLKQGPTVEPQLRDKEARFLRTREGQPDWYGFEREDFPYFYKEERKNYKSEFKSLKDQKKLPADFYDELPDTPDSTI